MLQSVMSRRESQRELRKFVSQSMEPILADDESVSDGGSVEVPANYERLAVFASASITALIKASVDETCDFRMTVTVAPYPDDEAERDPESVFVYSHRSDEFFTHFELKIHRIPQRLVDAPEEFQAMIFLYMCATAYVDEYERAYPEHKWGVKNPAERMALDAYYNVTDAQRAAARRSVFN